MNTKGACLGFIGAGQMARALAQGVVRAGLFELREIWAADPVPEAREAFAAALPGVNLAEQNCQVVNESDTVVLAVKPQSLPRVAEELSQTEVEGKLFVSILAGVSLDDLCQSLRTERVVRVMPNTPCLVGTGASAYTLGSAATFEDGEHIQQLLEAVGIALRVPEGALDAVTGLSGSGPAYIYTVIEALADGGVRMGLPRDTAQLLALHTVLGSARMVLETKEHPSVLRDRVTSPAGTTIAGLQVLEARAFRSALIDAVEAATRRSQELGRSQA